MGRLNGKIALVTAAGAGIGRATTEAFIQEGARVFATDIDAARMSGLACEVRQLDVRSTAAVEALAREIGRVDILFNCAGFVHHGSVLECSDEEWDYTFDVNVKSMHRTVRAFLPPMLERRSGSIINIASGATLEVFGPQVDAQKNASSYLPNNQSTSNAFLNARFDMNHLDIAAVGPNRNACVLEIRCRIPAGEPL